MEQAQAMKELMYRILGKAIYDKCHDFFQGVLESEYCYIIIMTRRCFTLYKIFSDILSSEGIYKKEKTIIITDKAIDLHRDGLGKAIRSSDHAVLAMDDVIIFGRTINNLLDHLFSCTEIEGVPSNVEVRCLVRNDDKTLIKENFLPLVSSYRLLHGYDWRIWSNRLSNLICESNKANTSYIISLVKNDKDINGIKNWAHIKCKSNKLLYIQWASIDDSTISDYIKGAFVRIYCDNDGLCIITPLVTLHDLNLKRMNDLCNEILNYLSLERNSDIRKLLISEDERLQQSRMQLVTLLLSHSLLRNFCEYCGIKYDLKDTDYTEILTYNFSKKICDNFYDNENNLAGLLSAQYKSVTEHSDMTIELYRKVLIASIVDSGKAAENSSVEADCPNIKRTDYLNYTEKCTEDYSYPTAILIDSGKASIRSVYSKEDGFQSLLYAGEQAYLIGADLLSPDLKYFQYAEFVYGKFNFEKLCPEEKKRFHKCILSRLIEDKIIQEQNRELYLEIFDTLYSNNRSIEYVTYNDSCELNTIAVFPNGSKELISEAVEKFEYQR